MQLLQTLVSWLQSPSASIPCLHTLSACSTAQAYAPLLARMIGLLAFWLDLLGRVPVSFLPTELCVVPAGMVGTPCDHKHGEIVVR